MKLTGIRPTSGYAAVHTEPTTGTDPWIIISSVKPFARDVRKYIGESYARAARGETWEDGWERALKRGVRVIRVRVEPKTRP